MDDTDILPRMPHHLLMPHLMLRWLLPRVHSVLGAAGFVYGRRAAVRCRIAEETVPGYVLDYRQDSYDTADGIRYSLAIGHAGKDGAAHVARYAAALKAAGFEVEAYTPPFKKKPALYVVAYQG